MYTIEGRVRSLDDVIGQDLVVKALTNLISNGAIPRVSVFLGQPGCGKTTIGEILASTILCKSPVEKNGYTQPCQKCYNCRTVFNKVSSGDFYVFNGITADDVDTIENSLSYAPQGKALVYLINEFHDSSSKSIEKFKSIFENTQKDVYFIITSSDVDKFKALKDTKSNEKMALASRMSFFNIKPINKAVIEKELFKKLQEVPGSEEIPESIFDVIIMIAENCKNSLRGAYNLFEPILNAKIYTEKEAKELLGFENDEKENFNLLSMLAKKDKAVIAQMRLKKYETVFYYLMTTLSNIAEAEIEGYDDKAEWQVRNATDIKATGNFEKLLELFNDVGKTFFNENYFKYRLYKYFNESSNKLVEKTPVVVKKIPPNRGNVSK